MGATVSSVVLFAIRVVRRTIGWALLLVVAGFLILFALQFRHAPKLDALWLIVRLHQWGDPVLGKVASGLHMTWPPPSFSFLALVLALGTWLVKLGVDATLLRGHRLLGRIMAAPQTAGAAEAGVGSDELAGLPADSGRSHEMLLKRYREIEVALKSALRKRCAFLSVDVVGSTAMKAGEDTTAIAATFQAFEEMVENICEQHGAWKIAWTPDGVMVCFLQLDLAVAAGQHVLLSLKKFNQTENKLRTSFRVRCGLNEGEVAIYEDSKLEKVVDHVIDVAGHMQKQGRPNTLWLSAEVYELLADKSGFRLADSEVDGMKVYEWALEFRQAPAMKAAS